VKLQHIQTGKIITWEDMEKNKEIKDIYSDCMYKSLLRYKLIGGNLKEMEIQCLKEHGYAEIE